MKTIIKISVIIFVLVIIPLGFLYFIANEGFSPYHAGVMLQLLTDEEIQERDYDSDPKNVTREDLAYFPELLIMIELLIQEKDNPQEPRSVIVDSKTYFISSEHEFRVQNFMSDNGAGNLSRDFHDMYGYSYIIFEGNSFAIMDWIS